jgi:hypothetical protein
MQTIFQAFDFVEGPLEFGRRQRVVGRIDRRTDKFHEVTRRVYDRIPA